MIGLTIELKAATVLPVNRAMYAKLTELMTDFDISIRVTMKGKKHNIKEKSIIVVSLEALFLPYEFFPGFHGELPGSDFFFMPTCFIVKHNLTEDNSGYTKRHNNGVNPKISVFIKER